MRYHHYPLMCLLALLALLSPLYAQTAWNPAAGIYIQRIGELYDSEPTQAKVFYTRYGAVPDRVKSIEYYYDGQGYLELRKKDTICNTAGADGIIHHPDGDLLIAGQGAYVHKVSRTAGFGNNCVVKSVTAPNADMYHLVMDPSNQYLWGLGIPGPLIRYPTSNATPDRLANGTNMELNPGSKTAIKKITTIAWDNNGTTFYTKSNYSGTDGEFGIIDMNTYKTQKLFDVDSGAHGMTFDEYSNTIFIFGNSHILQIDPVSRQILVDLDMYKLGFSKAMMQSTNGWANSAEVQEWRFDQGTVDGKGHLFVASNSGHLVFIDYTSNPNKRIDDNVLIHAQFIDMWLDDVAPLSGAGSPRDSTTTNTGGSSSSRAYSSSGYNVLSSSSLGGSSSGTSTSASSGASGSSGSGLSSGAASSSTIGLSSGSLSSSSGYVLLSSSGTGTSGSSGASSSGTGTSGSSGASSSGTGTSGSSGASSSGTGTSGSSGASSSGTGISGSSGASSSGTGTSGSSGASSSSGTDGGLSDSGTGSSSSGTDGGLSDSGTGSSSSGTDGGLSDSGTGSSSSGTDGGLSDSGTGSSSSGTDGGLSDSGTGSSSSGTDGGLSDSGTGGSSSGTGGGLDDAPWCKENPKAVGCSGDHSYGGLDDYGVGSDDYYDQYPTNDAREHGDSSVTTAVELIPADPSTITPGTGIVINGNTYLPNAGGETLNGYTPSFDKATARDSVPVGNVMALQLDMDKLKEYLCVDRVTAVVGTDTTRKCLLDSIVVRGNSGLQFVNPAEPSAPANRVVLDTTQSTLWVTSSQVVLDGMIFITGPDGRTVIYDGIKFYDPIPDIKVALLKDPDADGLHDGIEVALKEPVPAGYEVSQVRVLLHDKDSVFVNTKVAGSAVRLDASRDLILLDIAALKDTSTMALDSTDKVIVTYTNASGVNFVREAPLAMALGQVIKRALVLRDGSGADSLFVQFNITVLPTDLALGAMMVLVDAGTGALAIDADRVRLPAKDLVLFDDVTVVDCAQASCKVSWKGAYKDSLQLSELAVFKNMPYITSEEYARRVPVEVISRLPSLKNTEYYDTDGDGVMDSVVVQLASKVDSAALGTMYFAFPWYSSLNRSVQLQPAPAELILDAKDSSRVGWKVRTNVTLREGLTSIPSSLAQAELYVNYPVFDYAFQEARQSPIVDKMAPAPVNAQIRFGESADSLVVSFSEPVANLKTAGLDIFDYVHGSRTMHLDAINILWSLDGLTATVVLPDGADAVVPGDSLVLVFGSEGKVVADALGNVPVVNPMPEVIDGSLTHLVRTVDMASFDPEDDSLRVASSVTVSYMPSTVRTKDLRDSGMLGHIIELGQRFVPQLVDNATTGDYATETGDIDPEKVHIALKVQYFDHVGQFVTDTAIVIPCKSPLFGANSCLDTDRKLFVDWNFKDKSGRFVGSGVYLAQFQMQVRYEKKQIKEEMLDKWGVRRKK